MLLSIIIPVYNEKKTILEVLEKVKSLDLGVNKEIVVVDDFSTDGTRDLLKKQKGITVLYHDKNKGKGTAIRTALEKVKGDIIVIQDADLEYDPTDFKKLIQPILSGETKIVYGSRFLNQHQPKYHMYYLGNIFLSMLVRVIYGVKITDMETCYKMFKKEVLDGITLKARSFDIEPEITAKFIKRGHFIKEIPIWYKCRDFAEGKKISWMDGVKAAYYLFKYRITD